MVLNARNSEQMLPHIQRIRSIDEEVDELLRLVPGGETMDRMRKALAAYRDVRDGMLRAAEGGTLERERAHHLARVREAYGTVKQACIALAAQLSAGLSPTQAA